MVLIDVTCLSCLERIRLPVQFKYGYVWQLQYQVGDQLEWRLKDEERPWLPLAKLGNIGNPQFLDVVADGCAEDCPLCHKPAVANDDYLVYVSEGRITRVVPNKGYAFGDDTYLRLDLP